MYTYSICIYVCIHIEKKMTRMKSSAVISGTIDDFNFSFLPVGSKVLKIKLYL